MSIAYTTDDNIQLIAQVTSKTSIGVPIYSTPPSDSTHPTTGLTSSPSSSVSPAGGRKYVSAFHLPEASITPVKVGTWTGSVAAGATVNCSILSCCPHGAGTHTECIGHIVANGPSILDHCPDTVLPALVITLPFERLSSPKHHATGADQDIVVTSHPLTIAQCIADALSKSFLPMLDGTQELPGFPTEDISALASQLKNYIKNYTTDMQDGTPFPTDLSNLLAQLKPFCAVIAIRTYLPQVYRLIELLKTNADKYGELMDYFCITPESDIIAIQQVVMRIASTLDQDPSIPSIVAVQGEELPAAVASQINEMAPLLDSGLVSYNGKNPPYLQPALIDFLTAHLSPAHLCVDLPSVDREDDGGLLLCHKAFFHYSDYMSHLQLLEEGHVYPQTSASPGTLDVPPPPQACRWKRRTITELCWYPITLQTAGAGHFALIDIRVSPIDSDASPSLPLLYPLAGIRKV